MICLAQGGLFGYLRYCQYLHRHVLIYVHYFDRSGGVSRLFLGRSFSKVAGADENGQETLNYDNNSTWATAYRTRPNKGITASPPLCMYIPVLAGRPQPRTNSPITGFYSSLARDPCIGDAINCYHALRMPFVKLGHFPAEAAGEPISGFVSSTYLDTYLHVPRQSTDVAFRRRG